MLMVIYRICPNFRDTQFSRIVLSKQFAETIFADQEFRVYGIINFASLKFRELKITQRENLDVYSKSTNNDTFR